MRKLTRIRWFCYMGLIVLAIPVLSAAQSDGSKVPPSSESASAGDESSATRAFDHYVVRGGWITWVVLIPLSVTALAMVAENSFTIRRKNLLPDETQRALGEMLERGAYADAVQLSGDDRSVFSYIVYSGLIEARNGFAAMERAMEEAIDEQAARLSRRIEYLNIIGNVAPMVGLFGTVHGIIGMFISISDAEGIPVMSRISYDLGTALVATFWGLFVAIPSLTVFGLLRNRIDVLLAECAISADRMLSVFKPHHGEVGRAAATSGAGIAPVGASR